MRSADAAKSKQRWVTTCSILFWIYSRMTMISGQKDYHVVTSLGPGNAPEPATSITPPGDHALCRNLVLSIHIALIINQLRISLFVVHISSFYEDMHWQICKISKGAQFSPSSQSHESSMPLLSKLWLKLHSREVPMFLANSYFHTR